MNLEYGAPWRRGPLAMAVKWHSEGETQDGLNGARLAMDLDEGDDPSGA